MTPTVHYRMVIHQQKFLYLGKSICISFTTDWGLNVWLHAKSWCRYASDLHVSETLDFVCQVFEAVMFCFISHTPILHHRAIPQLYSMCRGYLKTIMHSCQPSWNFQDSPRFKGSVPDPKIYLDCPGFSRIFRQVWALKLHRRPLGFSKCGAMTMSLRKQV